MTGAAKMTVLSLLREVGEAYFRFHDAQVRGLETVTVQCDEVWSFCFDTADVAKITDDELRGELATCEPGTRVYIISRKN